MSQLAAAKRYNEYINRIDSLGREEISTISTIAVESYSSHAIIAG